MKPQGAWRPERLDTASLRWTHWPMTSTGRRDQCATTRQTTNGYNVNKGVLFLNCATGCPCRSILLLRLRPVLLTLIACLFLWPRLITLAGPRILIAISTFSAARGPPGLGLLISRAVRQVRRLQPKKEEPSETWTGPGEFTRSSLACFFCWKGPGGWQDVMEGGCPGSALPGAYRKKSSSGSLFARVLAPLMMADAGRWGDARCHVSLGQSSSLALACTEPEHIYPRPSHCQHHFRPLHASRVP